MKKYKIVILVCAFTLLGIFTYRVSKTSNVYERNENNQIKKHVDTISMMLETKAGSGNYEMTTRETWPTDGYVFNTILSKCENGSTLSWDDNNKKVIMSGNVSDKCYVYFDKIMTLSEYVIAQYDEVQGNNNIYYHDSSLENGAGDNSYRYAGASESVNNFVCFGSNESPCPSDNLYRIIGVFDGQVKLIKYDYATSSLLGTNGDYKGAKAPSTTSYKGILTTIDMYYWNNSTGTNTWSESMLNKTNLNTNFINNIGEEWTQKIATTKWKVGGNTNDNIRDVVPVTAYQNEVVNPNPTNSTDDKAEYTAKIGLMYVSDYGFAAEPSAWTLTMNNYGNATSTNWMYMGWYEWTISRSANGSTFGIIVFLDGSMSTNQVNSSWLYLESGCRPSFYLESSVTYVSGFGTQLDPIRVN